jgi:hypothetical protein
LGVLGESSVFFVAVYCYHRYTRLAYDFYERAAGRPLNSVWTGFVEILFRDGSSLAGRVRAARYRRPCERPKIAICVIWFVC